MEHYVPTFGSAVYNGYFGNANSENDGNFISTLTQFAGLANQVPALKVFGYCP